MFKVSKKSNSQIQQDVINELDWDPSITSTEISVTSDDGIVTLRGTVPHYLEKSRAEDAAQRVGGVRAVADEVEVNILGSMSRSDEQIARAALTALEWNYAVPKNVTVTIEKGWITLNGHTDWEYQRKAATDSVSMLNGVCGVTNRMAIIPKVQPEDVKTRIEEALMRSAETEGKTIGVSLFGDEVTLSGTINSFSEMEEAKHAAWMAPGVMKVINNMKIQ